MKFIGDVHGHFSAYSTILKGCKNSIQIGDMGVGFYKRDYEGVLSPYPNPPYDKMVAGGHRFIRGNHDNPNVCRRHSQYIPDGHIEGDMMFIGGGYSIDRDFRVLNETYWEDEELDYVELNHLVGVYYETKPRIMVTHDCPELVANHLFTTTKLSIPSRTRQAFNSMWENHKPELWIFGHWHDHRDLTLLGTRFVCLAELQTMEFDI
jgi:hypothetical protein